MAVVVGEQQRVCFVVVARKRTSQRDGKIDDAKAGRSLAWSTNLLHSLSMSIGTPSIVIGI